MRQTESIWAILPAAGIGRRMRADIPKQYIELCGRTILEHTLDRLLCIERIAGVVVALQPDDPYWPKLQVNARKPVLTADGGRQRCDSVLSAVETVLAQSEDGVLQWALVHDAVRPCVSVRDIERLIECATTDDHGGLLAMPVRDTMKLQNAHTCVARTVDRSGMWHALTPQLFKAGLLAKALRSAIKAGSEITDESSAMEQAGYTPHLVEGSGTNIKITRPSDLQFAKILIESSMHRTDLN